MKNEKCKRCGGLFIRMSYDEERKCLACGSSVDYCSVQETKGIERVREDVEFDNRDLGWGVGLREVEDGVSVRPLLDASKLMLIRRGLLELLRSSGGDLEREVYLLWDSILRSVPKERYFVGKNSWEESERVAGNESERLFIWLLAELKDEVSVSKIIRLRGRDIDVEESLVKISKKGKRVGVRWVEPSHRWVKVGSELCNRMAMLSGGENGYVFRDLGSNKDSIIGMNKAVRECKARLTKGTHFGEDKPELEETIKSGNYYRETIAAFQREYYEHNREKKLAYDREYNEHNREKIAAYKREYRVRNREKIAARQKEYYERNRELRAAYHREYYQRNREMIAACHREYYERNSEKKLAYHREYRKRNREKIAVYNREYYECNREKKAAYQREHRVRNRDIGLLIA